MVKRAGGNFGLRPLRRRLLTALRSLRPPFSRKELDKVLSHYDLGKWRVAQILEGGNSANVVVETSVGRKVLKRYYGSLEKSIREHGVIDRLAAVDFPVARLERTREGQTSLQLEDRHYALYEFVDGQPWSSCTVDSATQEMAVRSAGQTLALLDDTLKNVSLAELTDAVGIGAGRWPGQLEDHLQLVERYAASACGRIRTQSGRVECAQLADRISRDVETAWRYYQQEGTDMPRQIVHYDFAPKNLLFREGRVVAVLDFGEVRVDFRASDVVRGITSFAGNVREQMDWPMAVLFLNAYREVVALHARELESIPDLIRWRVLRSILTIMDICLATQNRPGRAGYYVEPQTYIRKKSAYMKWLEQQRGQFDWFVREAQNGQ